MNKMKIQSSYRISYIISLPVKVRPLFSRVFYHLQQSCDLVICQISPRMLVDAIEFYIHYSDSIQRLSNRIKLSSITQPLNFILPKGIKSSNVHTRDQQVDIVCTFVSDY